MVGAIVLLALTPAFGAQWKLGAPAPECTVEDPCGARRALSEFRGRKVVLLDSNGVPAGTGSIEGVVVVTTGAHPLGAERGKAYLIDEDGVVRRIEPAPSSHEGVASFIEDWEEGRAFFVNRCARCHGEDGADDSYPYIRTLVGIGSRLTRTQIRARLHPATVGENLVLVRGERFTALQFEALVTFIAGL
jgi:hypothetical protein